MISKMVIENFKSYGGVKEIGPFHKSFSSVVGPNGSGKSNVIDAMLFVFGKKASQMRFNKLSELIHRSAEYPDLGYARVSVFFQEIMDDTSSEDDYTVVPGSQVVVTRTASRSNLSTYYINEKKSTMTEVTTLLKSRGIDLDHNRFLILQGEVEQIAMMKPKGTAPGDEGLLEYLEDIIGSNAYVQPIAESEKVVEALNAQRGEKLNRVKIVEKERASLETAKFEAEALLSKEREIQRQQSLLWQKIIAETSDALTTSERKLEAHANKLSDAKGASAAIEAQVESSATAFKAAQASYDVAAKEHTALKDAMAALERKDVKLKEDLKHTRLTSKKLEEVIKKEEAAVAEATKAVAAATASLPTLDAQLVKLNEDKSREEAAYEGVLASLQGETEVLRRAMEAAQAALVPAAAEAAATSSRLEATRTELRLLKEKLDSRGKEVGALGTQLTKARGELEGKVAELEALRAEVAGAGPARAARDAELADIAKREAATLDAAAGARAKLEEGRAAEAEAGASSSKSGGSGGGVVDVLMAAAKKGGPLSGAGLHGRLGSLGTIDGKYDVAISTACGALNWLVVDNTEGGQACVEFLRAKGLGRAKFIILDKVAWLGERMGKAFAPPSPTTPRLFDLVQPRADAYRLPFYFALRDTLVAPDIDAAVGIAYRGGRVEHRVVTLAGELIDTSGTMSGGGGAARKGGMAPSSGPLVSAEEMAAAEAALAAATSALSVLRARKALLSAEGQVAARAAPKAATRASKLEMEVASLRGIVDDLAARHAAAAGSAGLASAGPSPDDLARLAELTSSASTQDASAKAAGAAAASAEKAVSASQKAILEAGGEKVARAKARRDRAEEACEVVIKAATKAKAEAKAAEKAGAKASAALDKARSELAESLGAADRIKKEYADNETEAGGVLNCMAAAESAASAAHVALAEASAAADAAEKSAKTTRDAVAELKAAVDEAEAGVAVARKKATYWRARWEALALEYAASMAQRLSDLETDAAADAEEGAEAAAGAAAAEAAAAAAAANAAAAASATAAAAANETAAAKPSRGRKAAAAAAGGNAAAAPIAAAAAAQLAPSSAAVLALLKGEPLELPRSAPEALRSMNSEELQYGLTMLEGQRDDLGKKVNMGAITEYRAKDREFLKRVAELEAVSSARDAARKQFDGLRKRRLDEFMAGFGVITLRLKEMYQMITLGGDAELELVDSLDPFSEGIVFSVRPPKKSWKNISNLSGGEKTLSSLALVFALHHYKPTPLYVMDEIDAALDFKNVSIVANYIKERTKDAQFIIISLRNNMFELADRLVGIYKTRDVTKSVTINPKLIAANCAVTGGPEGASSSSAAGAALDERPTSAGGVGL